jgi:GTP-binding protein
MSSEFIKSFVDNKDILYDYPQLIILGRSNVGKSSIINALTNRKSIAHVSKTPGKTITFNYYLVDNKYYLVDSPGYGYAMRGKDTIDNFITMLDNYLSCKVAFLVILLVDSLVGPTDKDIKIINEIKKAKHELLIVSTKLDKVNKSKRISQINTISNYLNIDVLPTSVLLKYNIEKLKDKIYEYLNKELENE